MRPVLRFQSQLLYRRSYKPARILRVRPSARRTLSFRPARAGIPLTSYDREAFPVQVRHDGSAPEAA